MSSDESQQPTTAERRTNVLLELSNTMVRLHKEQFGRGPTIARSNWAGPDTLICVLEDTLAPAERKLVKMGEHQRLRDSRMFLQYATVACSASRSSRSPAAGFGRSSAPSTPRQ